jgi:hypothetical protein
MLLEDSKSISSKRRKNNPLTKKVYGRGEKFVGSS